jgi:hypothetical protein
VPDTEQARAVERYLAELRTSDPETVSQVERFFSLYSPARQGEPE